MLPCHLPAPLATPPSSLQPFTAQLRGALHDGRALATHKLSHSSMPRSPTSTEAAISTSSESTRSDVKHILLLTSSLISRRFSSSTLSTHPHSTHSHRPAGSQQGDAARRPETMNRISHTSRACAQTCPKIRLCPLNATCVPGMTLFKVSLTQPKLVAPSLNQPCHWRGVQGANSRHAVLGTHTKTHVLCCCAQ